MSEADHSSTSERLVAFERVVAHYESALLRYASRILRDRDAAQDVVQNTFLQFLRRWKDAWEPGPAVSSWLYRVAHNAAVDHLRHEVRRHALHERHAAEAPSELPPDRGAAFRVSDEAREAAQALQALSLREQQLVILKVYEEKSYREIGEITGLTSSNVGYILHHAMKKLALALRERTPGDQPPPGGSDHG